MTPCATFKPVALAALSSVAAAGCGGSKIDEQDARKVAVGVLAAYENQDAETVCQLSSRAEREGFATAATKKTSSTLGGCISGAGAFLEKLTPLNAAFAGLKPGTVTDVRREGDLVRVFFRYDREFTRAELRELNGDDELRPEVRPLRSRSIKITREDGRLVAGF